jgi:hypothetical protein
VAIEIKEKHHILVFSQGSELVRLDGRKPEATMTVKRTGRTLNFTLIANIVRAGP